jgi:hypothetical protein
MDPIVGPKPTVFKLYQGFSKTIARFESRLGVSFPPLQDSPAVLLENLGEGLKK